MSNDYHSKDDAIGAVDETIGRVNEAVGGAVGEHGQVQAGRNEVSTGRREDFIGGVKDDIHNVEQKVEGFFHHGGNQSQPAATPNPPANTSTNSDGNLLDEIGRDINNGNL